MVCVAMDAAKGAVRMNAQDLAVIEAWIASQIADVCEMAQDDGIIIEIATAASNALKRRREGRENHGN